MIFSTTGMDFLCTFHTLHVFFRNVPQIEMCLNAYGLEVFECLRAVRVLWILEKF